MTVIDSRRRMILAGAFALALAACVPSRVPLAADGTPLEPLEVSTSGGVRRFWVEVADDDAERSRGLMFREQLAADHGMLFDFGGPQPASFWMRNTLVPLDIIFINADGTVRNIGANTIPFSEAPVPSTGPVRYVLELNAGQSAALGIRPGARVSHRLIPSG